MVDKAGKKAAEKTPEKKAREKWDPVAKAKSVGEQRIVKVLTALARLDKLATTRYRFTEAQVNAMFTAIRGNVDRIEARFRAALTSTGDKPEEEKIFSFDAAPEQAETPAA